MLNLLRIFSLALPMIAYSTVSHAAYAKKEYDNLSYDLSPQIKIINYGSQKINTFNGTASISGNEINPRTAFGFGGTVSYLKDNHDFFVNFNYLYGKKENKNIGLIWASGFDVGVESNVNILESFVGYNYHHYLPGYRILANFKDIILEQNIFFGGKLGMSKFDYEYEFIENQRVNNSTKVSHNSLSFANIVGYEMLFNKKLKTSLQGEYHSYNDLPGIKNSISISLNFSFKL